jgi:hypothetical protein
MYVEGSAGPGRSTAKFSLGGSGVALKYLETRKIGIGFVEYTNQMLPGSVVQKYHQMEEEVLKPRKL